MLQGALANPALRGPPGQSVLCPAAPTPRALIAQQLAVCWSAACSRQSRATLHRVPPSPPVAPQPLKHASQHGPGPLLGSAAAGGLHARRRRPDEGPLAPPLPLPRRAPPATTAGALQPLPLTAVPPLASLSQVPSSCKKYFKTVGEMEAYSAKVQASGWLAACSRRRPLALVPLPPRVSTTAASFLTKLAPYTHRAAVRLPHRHRWHEAEELPAALQERHQEGEAGWVWVCTRWMPRRRGVSAGRRGRCGCPLARHWQAPQNPPTSRSLAGPPA